MWKLSGKADLTVGQAVAVARGGVPPTLGDEGRRRLELCRALVERLQELQIPAYGITTGFGALRHIPIPPEDQSLLQENLIRSHAAGWGKPMTAEVVRCAILLRAHTLAQGHSGVRPLVVERLLQLLEKNILPYVPQKGSVGASGDLAPLSHLALVLLADPKGRFLPPDKIQNSLSREDFLPASEANLLPYGITPLRLEAKEGLALNNGTQFITAEACLLLEDGLRLLETWLSAYGMSFEALGGVWESLEPRLYELRPQAGQVDFAKRLYPLLTRTGRPLASFRIPYLWKLRQRLGASSLSGLKNLLAPLQKLLQETEEASFEAQYRALEREFRTLLAQHPDSPEVQDAWKLFSSAYLTERPVQDDYSFRCALQVFAAFWQTWQHLYEVVKVEINSVTDNPLLFPPERDKFLSRSPEEYKAFLAQCSQEELQRAIRSGGNFHGTPLGLPLDYYTIGLCELASIAERRMALLLEEGRSQGLPPFLAERPGVESGLMILQYTAAALVSENKTLAHPASVDTIPTSAGREDYVSMAAWAAQKSRQVFENVEALLAMEILTAAQALQFLRPMKFSPFVERALQILGWQRELPLPHDSPPEPALQHVLSLVKSGQLRLSQLTDQPAIGDLNR